MVVRRRYHPLDVNPPRAPSPSPVADGIGDEDLLVEARIAATKVCINDVHVGLIIFLITSKVPVLRTVTYS